MNKILPLFLLYFSLSCFRGNSQEIKYYLPFDTISSNSYFYLAGYINNKQLALKLSSNDLPRLFIFNDSGSLISQLDLAIPELNNKVVPVILVNQDSWTLVFQHKDGNTMNLAIARLDEFGSLLQPYTRLEISNIDKLGEGAYYNYSISNERKNIILYRMLLGLQQHKILTDYLTINSHGEILERGSHYIPYRKESQEITPLFQHSDGESYFAIYDKPDDYKFASKTSIYRLTVSAKDLLVKEIEYKATKPIQPVFASNTLSHELIFAALYYDHYSSALNGLLITHIDLHKSSVNASTNILPFTKTKSGELKFPNSHLKLKYRENRGDFLGISSCAVLGKNRNFTILFDNRFSVIKNSSEASSNSISQNTTLTVAGQSNLLPSQEFDLLRNHFRAIGTPSQQRAGNGSIFLTGQRIAPVSTRDIIESVNSEILSDHYVPKTSFGSRTAAINQDRIQIQLDKNFNLARKEKLSLNYNYEQLPVVSGNITSTDELVILSYSSNSNDNFILQLFDTVNPAYQALLINKNGYKPFYNDTFSFAGKKKIFTFFVTADDKNIGLALISW